MRRGREGIRDLLHGPGLGWCEATKVLRWTGFSPTSCHSLSNSVLGLCRAGTDLAYPSLFDPAVVAGESKGAVGTADFLARLVAVLRVSI